MTGLEVTTPPVAYFQRRVPQEEVKAYKPLSYDPTYTAPSDPIAGLDLTGLPVVYFQRILPHD